jgi:hypothetical protein
MAVNFAGRGCLHLAGKAVLSSGVVWLIGRRAPLTWWSTWGEESFEAAFEQAVEIGEGRDERVWRAASKWEPEGFGVDPRVKAFICVGKCIGRADDFGREAAAKVAKYAAQIPQAQCELHLSDVPASLKSMDCEGVAQGEGREVVVERGPRDVERRRIHDFTRGPVDRVADILGMTKVVKPAESHNPLAV